MLDGIDLEDKDNVVAVTTVIKAVLDGVKVRGRGKSSEGVDLCTAARARVHVCQ